MRHREFIYIGEPSPELKPKSHSAFLMLVQEAILLSLRERNLLAPSLYERCLNKLHQQYKRK